jgi:hypothetical protein
MVRGRSRKLCKSKSRHRKLRRSTRRRKQRGAGFFNTIKNRVGRIFGSKVDQEPVPLTPLPPLPISREQSLANAGNGVNNDNYVPSMPPNKNNSGNNNWVLVGKNTY